MKSSLNHIYRSIWSEVLNAWVAVSELTSAKGKRSGSSVLNTVLTASAINASNSTSRKLGINLVALALAYCFTFNAAQANPVGAQVVNGTAAISQIGNTLTVTNSPSAIINWQGFSINAGETTRFVQQSASSAVLNRVVGADPSQLLGTLTSNGKVFLINPNGILVGQGARIDVAGLVASTLNLSNEDFLAGKLNFGSTLNAGGIQNFGSITTPEGGTVYLVAPQVDNQGIITTPKGQTILAAGNTVQLMDTGTPGVTVQVTGSDNIATNVGQILADSGRIGMVGAVVKNSGTLSASSLVSEGGRVFLKASKDVYVEKNARIEATGTQGGSIEVLGNRVAVTDSASLDASGQNGGGTILVGGDYQGKNPDVQNAAITYFGPNASIKADAWNNGNGGKVILWADDTNRAYGSISAKGGQNGSNGGFIETSAHWLDLAGLRIDAAAPNGMAGTWLLDPWDLTVSATTSTVANVSNTWSSGSGATNVFNTDINNLLNAGTSVILQTTGTAADGNGSGNISVNAPIAKTTGANASLTLQAHNDIVINQGISSSAGLLNINLTADSDANNAGSIFINKQLNSNGGNIIASAYGNIQLNDGGSTNLLAGAGNVTLTSTGGSISGDPAGSPLDVQANSVSLNAKSGITNQFYVDAASISFNNTTSGSVRIYNNHAGASSFTGSNAGGSIILESFDSANPTTINSILAGGDIIFRMNTINIASPVNAGVNNVFLSTFTPNSAVSINGAATFDLTGAELSNITASKIVVGNDTFGNFASTASIGTLAAVNITNAANLEVVAPNIAIGAGNFTNTNGSLSLKTDSLTFGAGIINVGAAGSVMIGGKVKTQIDLGGVDAAGVLGLSAAGVGAINAGKLLVGDTFTSSMLVSNAISLANVTTLSLNSGTGGISGAGSLTVPNLAVRSVGSVDLGTSYSSVSNVAASIGNFTTPNNPNFKFKNSTALNVGAGIDGLSGISLSLSGIFNPGSPDSVIALISGAALTQSAGALLAGKAVYAEGSKVILTNANPTGVISGKATGSATGDIFNYTSNSGIWATTVNGFGGIQAASLLDPASIVLTASSAGITQDATGLITNGGGGLMLNTTGPVGLYYGNNVGALATGAGVGQIDFNNSGALVLGIGGNGVTSANQPINITSGGNITLNNPVSSAASGDAVVLAAGGNFINNAGAAAISAPSGRWLVYATNPASNTFGGLNSNNTAVWNTTIASTPPANVTQTGNRYLFSYQPTATFTSTNLSKTYGDDATAAVASAYSVSGLNAGVANAYLADTNATAFSGAPSVTSSGSLGTASVAGSPYAINATQGTLSALNGYALAYSSTGVLTVNPAALTIAANGYTKTYDGVAYSGGNGVTYTGFVNGESSTALGGALVYGGSSQGAINPGSYLITPGGLTSSNYTIGFVDGTLAVVVPFTPPDPVPPVPPAPTPPPVPPAPPAPPLSPVLDPGGGVGGTIDTFGGDTPPPPPPKPDDNAKKDDKDKDDNSNKGKKNANPEKC